MTPLRLRRAAAPFAVAILVAAAPSVLYAQQPPRTVVPEAELAELRGGFLVAGGVSLDFGAVVRTYVDGRLALESRLTWTETGAVTTRTLGDVPGAVDLAAALDDAMAAGLDIDALRGGQGILLSDANGATALMQNLQGGIQNLILNNADGRDLRQEVEITLTLPDLQTMQRDYSIDRLGAAIGQDINASLIRALGQ
jgi:hypothetical protein